MLTRQRDPRPSEQAPIIIDVETVKTVLKNDIISIEIAAFFQSEGQALMFGPEHRQGLDRVGVLAVGDQNAAGLDAPGKLGEGAYYFVLIPIVIQMVLLDIENTADFGPQIEKAPVIFAGLGHEILALADAERVAQLAYHRPDDKIGLGPGLPEAVNQPPAGSALAVSAADRNAFIAIHQHPQHLCILINRHPSPASQPQFRVIISYSRRDDHGLSPRI